MTRFQLILPVRSQNPPNFKVVTEWKKVSLRSRRASCDLPDFLLHRGSKVAPLAKKNLVIKRDAHVCTKDLDVPQQQRINHYFVQPTTKDGQTPLMNAARSASPFSSPWAPTLIRLMMMVELP